MQFTVDRDKENEFFLIKLECFCVFEGFEVAEMTHLELARLHLEFKSLKRSITRINIYILAQSSQIINFILENSFEKQKGRSTLTENKFTLLSRSVEFKSRFSLTISNHIQIN